MLVRACAFSVYVGGGAYQRRARSEARVPFNDPETAHKNDDLVVSYFIFLVQTWLKMECAAAKKLVSVGHSSMGV